MLREDNTVYEVQKSANKPIMHTAVVPSPAAEVQHIQVGRVTCRPTHRQDYE